MKTTKFIFGQLYKGYLLAIQKENKSFIYHLIQPNTCYQSKHSYPSFDLALTAGIEKADKMAAYDDGWDTAVQGKGIPVTAATEFIEGWSDGFIYLSEELIA